MRILIEVEIEVERTAGKFASRDEIEEALVEALDDPGSIDGLGADGESEYEVVSFEAHAVAVR